jgi:MFS transporter, DHA2 family, multidrug resistance protein
LINAARNTGGSIGVSLASNVLAHREQIPSEPACGERAPVERPVSDFARSAAKA